MLEELSPSDRLLLLEFLCAFAWTDLEITENERRFVRRILAIAKLGPEDSQQVERWLEVAPPPGDTDPKRVPPQHRRVFLDTVRAIVFADGKVDDEERANLERLQEALEAG